MVECLGVINEVLFAVKSFFGRSPRPTISSIIAWYFMDDEIFAACGAIYYYAEKLEPKSDELKNIKHPTGSGKKNSNHLLHSWCKKGGDADVCG